MIGDPKPKAKKMRNYKCRNCGETYEADPKTKGLRVWCSLDCAAKIGIKKSKKIQDKEAKKQWRKRKEQLEHEVGRKRKQSQEPLQKSINKIARLLDVNAGWPCLARPFENSMRLDAGHIYAVGSNPSLRYHLWNIHGQSIKSNRDLGGESDLMIEGIERRYGRERRDMVEGLKQKYPVLKLTIPEKKEALKIANRIIREIEKGADFTRDQVNEIIGIYK